MMPFAHNDSTRFISPTKTPEFLAAGRPVVSTSIRDVVRPYGEKGLVQIGDTVDEFVRGLDKAIGMNGAPTRMTGASRSSKPSSPIVAAISAPAPKARTASWTTTARCVRAIDARTVALSQGCSERRSIT